MRLGQIIHDTLRRDGTHIVDLRQFLHGSSGKGIKCLKMSGKHLGSLLSHLTDAQAVDQFGKIVFLGTLNRLHQIFRGLLTHPLQIDKLCGRKAVKVRHISDQAGIHQLLHQTGPQPLNIHGITGGKMGDVPQQLCRTLCTGTANGGTILITYHRCTAYRANSGKHIGHCALWPQ